ncbi:MAG: ANTAR domain-containing protein [Blautia sp.]|nr:ANTAR domain-containing protein [Blautia sp.]
MSNREEIQHSVLIVSGSEKFDALMKRTLPPASLMSVEFKRNAAAARRCILERYYDIVVVNTPLPDESGVEFTIDTADQCSASILIVVPSESYINVLARVTDRGVLALSKPFPQVQISYAVRFLMAQRVKIYRLEKKARSAEEKAEEIKLIDKAKFLLIENRYMTEDEAHRFIGKQAMDNGLSRKRMAQQIIEDFE